MFKITKNCFFLFLFASGLLFVVGFVVNLTMASNAEAASIAQVEVSPASVANDLDRPAAEWCSGLANYTDYYNGKPALFVYKGNNPHPYAVAVRFNGQIVPDAGNGVQTYTGPQFEPGNGWIGYYISTRWTWVYYNWNDDWRWSVRACFR
jgi:hypothetical protein